MTLFARTMHTSARLCVSRRAQRLLKRAKDDNLRHAVSLYHLTPSFYPTNVSGDKDPLLENEVTESILGPFYNGRSGRPFVQFTTVHELLQRQRREHVHNRRDTMGEMTDVYESPVLSSSLSQSSIPPDTTDARSHFVKQPTSYPTRRARDTAGHGDLYAMDELSVRSAQVRDALYGTVAGELPGLEIVREHERAWDAEKESS